MVKVLFEEKIRDHLEENNSGSITWMQHLEKLRFSFSTKNGTIKFSRAVEIFPKTSVCGLLQRMKQVSDNVPQ